MSGALADDVELSFEIVLREHARSGGAARHEYLTNQRLDRDRGRRKSVVVGRHIAPTEQNLTFRIDCTLDFLLASHA